MKLRPLALSLCLATSALASIPSTVTAQPAPVAASASATQRWTFDGAIHNNSLALSPDEGTAVVSYSERPDVVVYNLKTGKVRKVLNGFVTPRNIVFAPSGEFFYVSDSSLGTVAKSATSSLKTVSTLPAGPGAFGTVLENRPAGQPLLTPHTLYGAALLLGIGVSAAMAQMAMTRAYRVGKVLVVANLQYTGIIFSSLWGMLLWGDRFNWYVWLGMGVILASGIAATFYNTKPTPQGTAVKDTDPIASEV